MERMRRYEGRRLPPAAAGSSEPATTSAALRSESAIVCPYTSSVICAARVPDALGDVAYRKPRSECLGDMPMPKVVQPAFDPHGSDETPEAVGQKVGMQRHATGRVIGQHVCVDTQTDSARERGHALRHVTLAQEAHRDVVERDPTHLVRLRILDREPVGELNDGSPDDQAPGVEVDVGPLDAAQLTASRAGQRREPHREPEFRTLARRGVEDPLDVDGRGRPDLPTLELGWRRERCGIPRDPAPPLGLDECSPQHRVRLSHRCRREWSTAFAARLAQLAIEPVEIGRRELVEAHTAETRDEQSVDVTAVAMERRGGQIGPDSASHSSSSSPTVTRA